MVPKQKDQILREIENQQDKYLKLLLSIANIPAPTGKEQQKMEFIQEKLHAIGMNDVSLDTIGNCIAKLPSQMKNQKKKNILMVAHADTACDPGAKVTITQDETYIWGHGVCDNSAGVTGLLTTLELIQKYKLEFPNNLIIGFTVGEEGLGAKRGMKQIIKDFGKDINAVINVESHNVGRVTNQAIGQYRGKLSLDTKVGGHSFRNFGKPNANVILAQIVSDFSKTKLPSKKGKTTYNIAQMKGEGTINAISKNASCLFEMRSEDNGYLKKIVAKFTTILGTYKKQFPDIEIVAEVSAETPAVVLPINHRIFQLTMDAQRQVGITPKVDAGNTDGDVSLAAGIPTVTIGASEGWDTHSLQEYMSKKSLNVGIKQTFMVISSVAAQL